VEHATHINLLNHIKTLVCIRLMMTYEQEVQGFGLSKSLLTLDP